MGSFFASAVEERRFREDMERFLRSLPPGASKVRIVVRCAECGRRWERKVDLADRYMPEAFAHIRKEGFIHEGLYEHRQMEFQIERLA